MKYLNPIHFPYILLIIYRYYKLSSLHIKFLYSFFPIINNKLTECFVKFSIHFVHYLQFCTRCNDKKRDKKKEKRKNDEEFTIETVYHKLIKEILQLTQEKSIPHTKYWFHRRGKVSKLNCNSRNSNHSTLCIATEATGVVTLHFSKYLTKRVG